MSHLGVTAPIVESENAIDFTSTIPDHVKDQEPQLLGK
jgi:hypothetical protein